MHKDSLKNILLCNELKHIRRHPTFVGAKHLDLNKTAGFHCIILWFHSEMPDDELETIRVSLIKASKAKGEMLDKPDVTTMYMGMKQLVIS